MDLSDFAGRTVYLSFFVETDPVLRTTFYVTRYLWRSVPRSGPPIRRPP